MKLRYSPTSPYVRKVMIVAKEAGLDEGQAEPVPLRVVQDQRGELRGEPGVLGVGTRFPHKPAFDKLSPAPVLPGSRSYSDSV